MLRLSGVGSNDGGEKINGIGRIDALAVLPSVLNILLNHRHVGRTVSETVCPLAPSLIPMLQAA